MSKTTSISEREDSESDTESENIIDNVNEEIPSVNEEIPSVDDALNEYFRLKEKFEADMNINKRKIINNITLSKKEKRTEFLKLMPKCVNCKRPSKKGTLFSVTYNPSNDKTDAYRTFKAICGNLADPCNLNIEINIGKYEHIDEALNYVRNEINKYKNSIIDDKNKLLFGLITTETALENFDSNKSYVVDMTSIYETYLDVWNKKVENPEKKTELEEALVQSYQSIDSIKDCIKKMNEANDKQYAVDAATIYHTTLQPLLNKIRQLKYRENNVSNDDKYCRLIQRQYIVDDILISSYDDNVVAYDVGLKAKKIQTKKPGLLIIEDSSEETIADNKQHTIQHTTTAKNQHTTHHMTTAKKQQAPKEITIQIQEPEPSTTSEIEEEEPIIGQGKDGIAWNNPEYQRLWDALPIKLKTEFKLNIDWMKKFMNKCINDRKKPGFNGCKLVTPPNIVIPPRKMDNGQYDFGVSIYNTVFNKLSKSVQETYLYLTFYDEDPAKKIKKYDMFTIGMNKLVEQEVNFGRGFF
jgi:hypothetical protein